MKECNINHEENAKSFHTLANKKKKNTKAEEVLCMLPEQFQVPLTLFQFTTKSIYQVEHTTAVY